MIVTVNGERSLRRYRLVITQKSKLRLTPEVHLHPKVETIASQLAGSSPVPLIGNTCMDMLRMDTARLFGCVLPTMETRSSS